MNDKAVESQESFRPLAGLGQISRFQAQGFSILKGVSVPSRGWGRSHRVDYKAVGRKRAPVSVPSRGWGRSHMIALIGGLIAARFPSPRGVGADLTSRPGRPLARSRMVSVPSRGWGRSHCDDRFDWRAYCREFPSPRGVGADLTYSGSVCNDACRKCRVSVPSRGWGRSHR